MDEVADGRTVQERLTQVEGHLLGGSGSPGAEGSKGKKGLLEKKPDDVSYTSCL
jgi:acetyl-CoA acyltransferase 1